MKREEIEERLRKIAVDLLECEESDITAETKGEDLGADSLDEIEMLMETEKVFGIYIENEEAVRVLTFGDAVELITKKLEDKK